MLRGIEGRGRVRFLLTIMLRLVSVRRSKSDGGAIYLPVFGASGERFTRSAVVCEFSAAGADSEGRLAGATKFGES